MKITATLLILFHLSSASALLAGQSTLGQVLDRTITREQVQDGEGNLDASLVQEVFGGPLWQALAQEKTAEFQPSETEVQAFLEFTRERLAQERAESEQELRALQELRAQRPLTEQEQSQQEALEFSIRFSQNPSLFFVQSYLSNWKLQKYLYENYGQGRVIWQQMGLEALDASHKWLQSQEDSGRLRFDNPEARELFYEYYNREHSSWVLDEEQVQNEFLQPEWLRVGRKD